MRPASKTWLLLTIFGSALVFVTVMFAVNARRQPRNSKRAREAALRSDLRTLRWAIDNFTIHKQEAPQSLEDLVSASYIPEIPVDPLTGRADWVIEFGDVLLSPDQKASGVTDGHSKSSEVGLDGTQYNGW